MLLGAVALAVSPLATGCGRLEPRTPPPPPQSKAADFALKNHDGSEVTLASLLRPGPAVILFHRGHW